MCGYADDRSCAAGTLETRICDFPTQQSGLGRFPKFWDFCCSVTVCVPVCRIYLLSRSVWSMFTATVPISKFVSVFDGLSYVYLRVFWTVQGGGALIRTHREHMCAPVLLSPLSVALSS